MTRRFSAAVPGIGIALIAVTIVSGCSTTATTHTPEPSAGEPTVSGPFARQSDPFVPIPEAGVFLKFGELYSWADGVDMVVTGPASISGSPSGPDRVVAIRTEVTNNDTRALRASDYTVQALVNGTATSPSQDPVNADPGSAIVEPGKSMQWTRTYRLKQDDTVEFELVVSVRSPAPGTPVVVFRGAV